MLSKFFYNVAYSGQISRLNQMHKPAPFVADVDKQFSM